MVQSLDPQVIGANVIMTAMTSSAIRLIEAILAEELIIVHVEPLLRGEVDIALGAQEALMMVEVVGSTHCRLREALVSDTSQRLTPTIAW